MKKTIKYLAWTIGMAGVIFVIIIGLFAISWDSKFGDCGMSVGPIYGDSIIVDKKN